MSRWSIVVVALVAACSSKHENPKPAQAAPPQQPAQPSAQHLGFVPDSIAARLGHSVGVAALDMRAFKADPLLALIPEPFACTRDLLKYMGVVVLAVDDRDRFTMYATQLSEANTKACLDQIAPILGVSTRTKQDGTYEIDALSLHWDDGVLTVQELGSEPPAPASADAELLAMLTHVPPQAPGFLLTKRTPDGKQMHLTVWFELDHQTVIAGARVEGKTAGDAHDWVDDLVQGFKDGARQRHVAVDDAWFKETDDGLVATLDARIPLAAITAGESSPPLAPAR